MPAKPSAIHRVDWPILILGLAVLLSTCGFAVYYYLDRYGHPDQPILDRQIQSIETAVQKNPQNPDLRVAAASHYLDAGLIDQAVEQSQEALKINPQDQGAMLLLAAAYEKRGDLGLAVAQLYRVVELNKDNPLARLDPQYQAVEYQLGMLYSQQGNYAEAMAALKTALDMNSADADALYALGGVYQKQNDHAAAIQQFEKAIRFVPDFAEAYQALALSDAALGRTAEANYARAMVLLSQSQPADAAGQLERLIAQSPDMKHAYLGLGLAYEKLGRRAEALKALQQFATAYPNDIAAQQALGRLSKGN